MHRSKNLKNKVHSPQFWGITVKISLTAPLFIHKLEGAYSL